MSTPPAKIPFPVEPAGVFPTPEGRWVFLVIAADGSKHSDGVSYYSAPMARTAMADFIMALVRLNNPVAPSVPAPAPISKPQSKFQAIQGGKA